MAQHKYLEIFNDKILSVEVIKEKNHIGVLIDRLKLEHRALVFLDEEHESHKSFVRRKLFNISYNNINYNIALFRLVPSGDVKKQKNDKRIQVYPKQIYNTNTIILGVYDTGNKLYYFTFKNLKAISPPKKSASVWIKLNAFLASQNIGNISYKGNFRDGEQVYISNKIEDILDIDERNFKLLNKNEMISDYPIVDAGKFKDVHNKVENYRVPDELPAYGRICERYIDFLLTNQSEIITDLLPFKFRKYKWINKDKESYAPYDFEINDGIYIDVKGTHSNSISFFISANEQKFRESLSIHNYYIFNLINFNEICSIDRKSNVDIQKNNNKLYVFNNSEIEGIESSKIINYRYHKKI